MMSVVIAVWLSPLDRPVNLGFASVAAYLDIIIGRRLLERKNL
jgi:hypothetical protein